MAMTTGEVRLTKWDGRVTESGREYDIELDVDFVGDYDGIAASALTSVTPLGLSAMLLDLGSEIGGVGSGVYVSDRSARMGTLSYNGSTGEFTIVIRANETSESFSENPLTRKDVIAYRRDGELVPISRDRNGKVIATYRAASIVEELWDPNPTAQPIEIFAQLPTVRTSRFSATITGYREEYRMAFDSYDPDGVSNNDPAKQIEFNVVNQAEITLDGVTWPIGTACLVSASARRVKINGYSAIEHSWNLEFKPSWNLRILNAGTYEFDDSKPAGKELQRIIDPVTSTFRTTPWPLDEDGLALPVGFTANDLVYVNFTTTRPGDFSYFGWTF